MFPLSLLHSFSLRCWSRHLAAASRREVVILIKPQFEVGRELVGKGGIVKDEAAQQAAVERVRQKVEELGGKNIELMESPILGMEGNREFLLHTDSDEKSILMKKASIISKQGKPELGKVVVPGGRLASPQRLCDYRGCSDARVLPRLRAGGARRPGHCVRPTL